MHGYFTSCLKEGRGGVESNNYDDEMIRGEEMLCSVGWEIMNNDVLIS